MDADAIYKCGISKFEMVIEYMHNKGFLYGQVELMFQQAFKDKEEST
jgi:hypothetical protein